MRVKRGVAKRRRKKKWLKQAKGYWGRRSNLYRTAREAVMRSLQYAYRDRRRKKREFRRLWILRINAACRIYGLSYSTFIDGLKKQGVEINRKLLAELASEDIESFSKLAELAKKK